MSSVTTIPNLGPASEAAFHTAGITTAEQLRALGPDAAYGRLLQSGQPPHFIGYYVLVMGLQGRPWNDCKGAEKAALKQRFEALKHQHFDTGRSELDRFMDDIGLLRPKGSG